MLSPHDFLQEFCKSKKNANSVLELEKSLLSNEVDLVLQSIDAVQELLIHIFNNQLLQESPSLGTNEEQYRSWLFLRYENLILHLTEYLSHEDENVQGKSLEVLMKAVELEGQSPIQKKETWFFPKQLFEKIVFCLLVQDVDQQSLIMKFQPFCNYNDIKLYLLKAVQKSFKEVELVTDVYLSNCFYLMSLLKFPKEFFSKENPPDDPGTLIPSTKTGEAFYLKKKTFCKLFTSLWCQFLKLQLPSFVLKRTLIILHKQVISHLQNPSLLTDFLTDAYKQGGIVSLLALHSLYYLMDRYNIEYPDFFVKLYSLTDKEIVNSKYSGKFFYLCDIFLSSTHLSASVVAAFAKKLARIALTSRIDAILKIIPLICNLLIRHPTLNTLVHRPQSELTLSADPYIFDSPDPEQSNALESSLWEIKTLQHHIHPEVSRKAKLINRELPIMELDLAPVLDGSCDTVYKIERKRKFIAAPININKTPKLDNWWILHGCYNS